MASRRRCPAATRSSAESEEGSGDPGRCRRSMLETHRLPYAWRDARRRGCWSRRHRARPTRPTAGRPCRVNSARHAQLPAGTTTQCRGRSARGRPPSRRPRRPRWVGLLLKLANARRSRARRHQRLGRRHTSYGVRAGTAWLMRDTVVMDDSADGPRWCRTDAVERTASHGGQQRAAGPAHDLSVLPAADEQTRTARPPVETKSWWLSFRQASAAESAASASRCDSARTRTARVGEPA